MRRYLEWDYVADTVIEYERHGECNCCGVCCESDIAWIVCSPYKPSCRSGGRRTDSVGIWQEVYTGRWRYFFRFTWVNLDSPTMCGQLTEDKLCAGNGDKDFLCREWPFSPYCVAPFSECSYSFTEVQRGRISEWDE